MATVVEAAGNLVFQLIMNSVRELYLPRIELFAPVVARPGALAPLYTRGAEAIAARESAPGGRRRSASSPAPRSSGWSAHDERGPRRADQRRPGLAASGDAGDVRARPPPSRAGAAAPPGPADQAAAGMLALVRYDDPCLPGGSAGMPRRSSPAATRRGRVADDPPAAAHVRMPTRASSAPGAGGAVAAAELAEGGLDVVLLEQGPDHDPRTLTRPPLRRCSRGSTETAARR